MKTRESKRQTRLSLHNLLKEGKEVWVRNMTGTKEFGLRHKRKGAGPICLMVGVAGNSDNLPVPPGQDPVCLTDMTDLESLKTCRDLFKALDRGGLDLIDPAEAAAYYEENAGRRSVMEKKVEKYRTMAQEKEVPQQLVEQSFAKKSQREAINPKVPDLCLKAKHKVYTEEELFEHFLEIGSTFGEAEFQYISSNGGYQAVKDWAKDMLKSLLDDPIEQS